MRLSLLPLPLAGRIGVEVSPHNRCRVPGSPGRNRNSTFARLKVITTRKFVDPRKFPKYKLATLELVHTASVSPVYRAEDSKVLRGRDDRKDRSGIEKPEGDIRPAGGVAELSHQLDLRSLLGELFRTFANQSIGNKESSRRLRRLRIGAMRKTCHQRSRQGEAAKHPAHGDILSTMPTIYFNRLSI